MRRPALLLAAFAATVMVLAPTIADAQRRGGSFGSRGARTQQAPPPTQTAPNAAQPMQRSIEPARPAPQAQRPPLGQPNPAGGFFSRSPIMAGLMGGLLGMGIFGLLSGSGLFGGFGGFASILGLLLQIGLVVLIVRLAIGWYRRRQAQSAPAMAGMPAGMARDVPREVPGTMAREAMDGGRAPMAGGGGGAPSSDIQLTPADFEAFERTLQAVNNAWTQHDEKAMRAAATPEMVQFLGDDLADLGKRGLKNETRDSKLEQGDLAEAWREGSREFATVAMRYSFVDVTRRISDGTVVEGDPDRRTEAIELWTFMRVQGGPWMLSAIQQTR